MGQFSVTIYGATGSALSDIQQTWRLSTARQCMFTCMRGGISAYDPERIKENNRIHRLQSAVLPVRHLSQNSVGDAADPWLAGDVYITEKQVGKHPQAINLFQMGADIAGGQARRIKSLNGRLRCNRLPGRG